jgi:iron complex outermembrane recepter protein
MHRSRSAKRIHAAQPNIRPLLRLRRYTPIALAIMTILRGAAADAADAVGASGTPADDNGGLEEVVVTATKRTEDQQSVPISIQALSSKTLQDMNVQQFADYAQQLTTVTFQQDKPGHANITMRGIASDSGGNPSGSLPTVGMYLDEQPITTIQGPIDIHMYDISRVEVLPGPQGTLYGASSEAGTIRVITNKPDPSGFAAGYDMQANTIKNGTAGAIGEGFVNLPITADAAARLVGWYERDSGYIDNVFGTVTSNGHTFNNAPFVADHFNPVDTYGGRAALKVDLNDNWTITPQIMAQSMKTEGIFAEEDWKDLAVGPALPSDLSVRRFAADNTQDNWTDASLTVQGKIGNFDITYASSYLKRDTHGASDYSDYEFFYQQYTKYWPADTGFVNFPASWYQQFSNELRIATPQNYPVRFVGGLYQMRQLQNIFNNIATPGNERPQYEVGYPNPPDGYGGTEYLLDEQRVNRDSAIFGEATWDITSKLTLLGGLRRFKYDNTLEGFYGFGPNAFGTAPPPPLYPGGPPGPGGISGQQTCFTTTSWHNAPCEDISERTSGAGYTPKINLSYKLAEQVLVYATYSKGFRPGGVNRTKAEPPYAADYLKNYEVGWKTTLLDNRMRFNGALYYEQWNNFQFGFTGQYGIPLIANAGNAEVKGADMEIEFAATRALTLKLGSTYTDSYLTQNYCGALNPNGSPVTSNPCVVGGGTPFAPLAPTGTRLPETPRIKTTTSARYLFPLADWEAHVEGDLVYQTWVSPALRVEDSALLGEQPAYALTNLFFGAEKNGLSLELLVKNAFDRRASLYRYTECGTDVCGVGAVYNVIAPPRLIGIQFGQKF